MNSEPVSNGQLAVAERDGHTVVTLRGELDISSCPKLRRQLAQVLTRHRLPLIVDLSCVTFCDAAGLAMLVGARARARRAGTSLYVTGGQPQVERVLRVTELERVLRPPPKELWPDANAPPPCGSAP